MKIALGCDHRGADAVRTILEHTETLGHDVIVFGRCDEESCDYPDQAYLVGRAVADETADYGVLICGSGVGMSMAANKIAGVRAALIADVEAAEMARRHNDANVLCMAGGRLGGPAMIELYDVFTTTSFEGGRHARRVAKIGIIEQGGDPRDYDDDSPAADE